MPRLAPIGGGSGLCPVYAYYPKSPGAERRFYYSLDADDHSREPVEFWERFCMQNDFGASCDSDPASFARLVIKSSTGC